MWHLKNGMYERTQAIYNSVCVHIKRGKEGTLKSEIERAAIYVYTIVSAIRNGSIKCKTIPKIHLLYTHYKSTKRIEIDIDCRACGIGDM